MLEGEAGGRTGRWEGHCQSLMRAAHGVRKTADVAESSELSLKPGAWARPLGGIARAHWEVWTETREQQWSLRPHVHSPVQGPAQRWTGGQTDKEK